jgi:hypothetical protein
VLARVIVRHIDRVRAEIPALLFHACQPFGCTRILRRVRYYDCITGIMQFRTDRFSKATHAARHYSDSLRHPIHP